MFWGLAPEAPSSGRTGGVEGAGTNGQRYPAWGSALGPGTALSSCRGVPTASLSDIPRSSLSPHPQQGRVCAITLTAAPARAAAHGHTRGTRAWQAVPFLPQLRRRLSRGPGTAPSLGALGTTVAQGWAGRGGRGRGFEACCLPGPQPSPGPGPQPLPA